MSERKRIAFEDIRAGDKLQVEWKEKSADILRSKTGVADRLRYINPVAPDLRQARWLTSDSGLLVTALDNTIYLLDRPEPPEPDVPVGTAGYATVWGVPNVRVMRTGSPSLPWEVLRPQGSYAQRDKNVTDFRPDVVLTDLALVDLRNQLIRSSMVDDIGDHCQIDEVLSILRQWAERLGVRP